MLSLVCLANDWLDGVLFVIPAAVLIGGLLIHGVRIFGKVSSSGSHSRSVCMLFAVIWSLCIAANVDKWQRDVVCCFQC